MSTKEYDVVVLGGNLAGVQSAISAAKEGLKTAIVDEERIGGLYTISSELPLEKLLSNNRLLNQIRESGKDGLLFSGISFEPEIFFETIEEESEKISEKLVKELRDNKVDIYIGKGQAQTDRSMVINREDTSPRHIKWKNLIYSSNPVTKVPYDIRSNAKNYYTSSNLGELDHFPDGLIIYGYGEKAVYLAKVWSNLGSKVYIICPKDRLIGALPKDVEDRVVQKLRDRNVDIYLDTEIAEIYQDSNKTFHVEFDEDGSLKKITGNELIVLGNEEIPLTGVEFLSLNGENGWIQTNEYLETSYPNVYTWTGSSRNFGREGLDKKAADYLAKYIAGNTHEPFEYSIIPHFIELNPTFGVIGKTEVDEDTKVGRIDDGKQFVEIYVNPKYGEIVGAQSYHDLTKDIIRQVEFLMKTEASAEDLMDLEFSENNPFRLVQEAIKEIYKDDE